MNNTRDELVTAPMGKLFVKLALPGVVGMVAIGLYQLVDAIFVGNMVGKEALAAISIVYPLTLINTGISVLFGVGSASVLSRAMGAKDNETVSKIFGNLTIWVFLLSIITMLLFFFFAEPLVRFMGAEDELIVTHGTNYLKIIALGSIFVNFAQASNMLIRGEGRMKEAMLIMGLGTVLNIFLDPICIKVLGWGIQGAAIATIFSQFVMAIMCIVYFKSGTSNIPSKKIKLDSKITPEVLAVGVSAMFMQVMSLIQQAVMYKTIAVYGGGDELAVMGAAIRLMAFAFIPVWGISQGFQPVVGMNYGAKKYDRVKKAYGFFTGVGSIFTGVAWICFMIFPKGMLGWFIKDQALIESGYPYVREMLALFVCMSYFIMSVTLFQATGKASKASFTIISRQVVFFVPLVLILPRFMGMDGIALATPIADALVCVISLFMILGTFREMKKLSSLDVEAIAT
ncbi:MAG: MATE family efflux transporter [Spirochaetales bacterium]|nr:MATE family efflux transporter [Spirochaetales bacterium]